MNKQLAYIFLYGLLTTLGNIKHTFSQTMTIMDKMTAQEQTRQVVEKYYQELASRNYENAAQLFADTVEWRIPGNSEIATWIKDRNSRDDIRSFFKDLYKNLEGISFDISGKFYEGNQAVVTGHLVSRILRTGKLFDTSFTVQFTVEQGLITRYLMLEDSHGLVESLKSELSNEQKIEKVKSYFEKVDNGDRSFLDLFTEDVEFFFPKFGITYNKKGIEDFSTKFGALLQRIEHDIEGFTYHIDGNTVVVEGRKKGITQTGEPWPDFHISQGLFCGIFSFEGGLISRYYIYVDPDFTSQDTATIDKLK